MKKLELFGIHFVVAVRGLMSRRAKRGWFGRWLAVSRVPNIPTIHHSLITAS